MRTRAVLLILAAVCAALFFGRLGAASLWDIDETNNARAAVEMAERGDLVVPTINGALRTDKPPLHYWLMMAGYQLFGVGEWGARFFAAFASTLTVLLVGAVGCAWFGSAGGLLAGLALASSLLFTISARAATTDAFLVLFVTSAVLAGFAARSGPRASRWALLAWAAAGMGVLAKGPVALALPVMALAPAFLLLGEGKAMARRLLLSWGVPLFLAIALPWYVLAALRTGGELTGGFLLTHNLGRFLAPMESHRGPFWFYLLVLLLGFFPFACFLPQAFSSALSLPKGLSSSPPPPVSPSPRRFFPSADPRGVLLLCWAAVVVLFFSLSATKLTNYILSAFPALALAMGALGERLDRETGRPEDGGKNDTPPVKGLALCWWISLPLALVFPLAVFLGARRLDAPLELWALWVGAPAVLGVALALAAHHLRRHGLRLARPRSPTEPFFLAAAGAALLAVTLHQALAPSLEPLRTAPRLGRLVAELGEPGDAVAAYRWFRPSLPFYAKRTVERVSDPEALAAFLSRPEGKYVVLTQRDFESLPDVLRAHLWPADLGPDLPDSPRVLLLAGRRAVPPPLEARP